MKNKKRKQRKAKLSAFLNPKKCKKTRKTQYANEKLAGQALMRIWSHDPKADINDLHVYKCPDCAGWHIGHKRYYQEKIKRTEIEITDSVSILVD